MADQNMKVTSPVAIESDSKQRVALDLASKIDSYSQVDRVQKDKKYWFTLYRQCYKAVEGYDLQQILQED